MCRLVARSIVVVMLACWWAGKAAAVVIEVPVTPASVKEAGQPISVKAETRADGLIHFTITYRPTTPQYLVAHVEVRDGATLVMSSDSPSIVREDAATFYLTVPPKRLADAKFALSVRTLVESDGKPVPMPGGTDFQVQLEAFGKEAAAAKVE